MKNKYNFAALFALALAAALVLNAPVCAQAPPGSLWYNGDFNGINGLANEQNTIVSQAGVYDDFNVTGSGITVSAVFSDNLASTNFTGASWEIRSGVSEMNAGTLIGSGSVGIGNDLSTQTTGRSGFGFTEYQVEVTGLSLFLAPGTYFLNVTPTGDGTGRSFDSTTSGANCIGTPCGNNGNAWFNSTFFGTFFDTTVQEGQPYDYSMGVIGNVVPEPAPWAMMAMGAVVLVGVHQLRRSRKNYEK